MSDAIPRKDHAPDADLWVGEDGHKHEWEIDFDTLERRCQLCDSIFMDMESYLCKVCGTLEIESVLDVGTGLKGVVGEDYWTRRKRVKQGWACDIWVIKDMPQWKPLKMDALELESVFEANSVDVVQAFGFLEHLEKEDGYRFLEIAESIARKVVMISAATEVHGSTNDYKVLRDGNPYHYYKSSWSWQQFEEIGYTSNFDDKVSKRTFSTEAIAWKVL